MIYQCQSPNVSISSFESKSGVLEREIGESKVLTHSYHRAELPRDPSHPLLRCLSKQKQIHRLLERSGHFIVKANREIHITSILSRWVLTEGHNKVNIRIPEQRRQ
jgi:hypothetical protein